jgi:type I restriction enzyme S subunit
MHETLVGNVPDDWRTTTLGMLCEAGGGDIQTGPFGSQLHASDYVPCGIPSVMPQNIGDNIIVEDGIARITAADAARLARYLLRDGDIVYSRRGDVERRALVRANQEGWLCGTGCLRVRAGYAADSRFISYYLGHPEVRAWIVRHAIGATMPNLNTGILSAVPIALPPLPMQHIIAAALGALDDKIMVNDQIKSTAGKLLSSHFSASIQSAQRGAMLGDIVDLRYGKALKEESRIPGSIPVYGGNGISGWHDTPLVEGPGIVIGRKGANAGSVSWAQGSYWPLDTAFYATPISDLVSNEFLFLLLDNIGLRGLVGDSAIPGLNREIALGCEISIPARDVIGRFTSIAQPLLSVQAHMSHESWSLAALRDVLLPKLMSGEIRVRDAEKIVGDAT